MKFSAEEIDELKCVVPELQYCAEGGYEYFLLPNLVLPTGCTPAKVDALLCPMQRDGYTSRLFFPEPIQSMKPLNWNGTAFVMDRRWHAFSWSIPETTLRPAQMLAQHLGALR